MKNEQNIRFADFLTAKRKIKQEFFNQVNLIVDWRPFSNIIKKHYSKGLRLQVVQVMMVWFGSK